MMLTAFFDRITRLSVKYYVVTLAIALIVSILGILALRDLNLELLPRIEFPQTVIVVQWSEAESSEQFADEITIPLEDALTEVDGVVNVESTTSTQFSFIIVRNDFGLNQDAILEDIETAIDTVDLPAGVEAPQVLNFSLSDLPVVISSVSSPDLTLPELKTLVEEDLQPSLEELDDVSQVTVSGGQELPEEILAAVDGEDEEAEAVEEEPTPAPTAEPTATVEPTAEPTPDPAALPEELVQGFAAQGLDIETAGQLTPDFIQQMTALGDFGLQALALLSADNLRALPPESIAYLPPAFLDTQDEGLVAELDELAAEFGGAGALALVEDEEEPAGGEEELADLPVVEPVPLPESWVAAAAGFGQTITTTADITAEGMQGILGFAPELLPDLEPEMWRALDPAVLAVILPEIGETLEPELAAQLQAIVLAAVGMPAEPVALPESWIAAATAAGFPVTTTADINADFVALLSQTSPNLLADLTPEMILGMAPETQAALPEEFLATLDEGLLQTLAVIAVHHTRFLALNPVEGEESTTPVVEPVPLPESWVAAAAGFGQTITTTADITAEGMQGILGFAPELLPDLEPEMWRALDPAVLAVVLPEVGETLDPALLVQLQAIVAAANGETQQVALPESWVAGAAQAGLTITSTAGLTPEIVAGIVSFAPDLLAELTPEMLLAMSPEVLAALPPEYLAALDVDTQQSLAIVAAYRLAADAPAGEEVAETPQEEATPTPEPEPTAEPDPGRLPDILIQAAAQAGQEIEFAQDLEPDFIRLLAGIPQAGQILGLLTEDNLRLLPPESIALLPADFLETLDPELRAELDELAAEFGGAGQLALEEAEAAEAASAGAPPLPEAWLQPGPDGEAPIFTTAADLVNNAFGLSAAELLNFLPDSPNAENVPELIAALNPEVLSYLVENEAEFLENLSPTILELMSAETLTYLLETYPDAFDAELTERLQGIATGDVEVFIPESSITRTDGDPAVILSIFKDGDANTVEVAHDVFEILDAFQAEQAAEGVSVNVALVFEQATFIEDSIEGVSREGILGAFFAVVVILVFLSGRNRDGKLMISWRSTAVIAMSIPLSILAAFTVMRWMPPTIGVWMNDLANSTDSTILDFIARLFPTNVTLNIMTLSGLTVAIGRVVDDSIVVLENIYRYIQDGDDPKEAVAAGTKEVAIAIFSSTVTTIAVFLPLGLIGGLIGSFFLPFGLTVTYSLAASFIVAITLVPALAFLLIRKENLPEQTETTLQRWYTPSLKWALKHRAVTMVLATILFLGSLFLLSTLPTSFIPELGEPTVNVSISLPAGTGMVDTNTAVAEFEAQLAEIDGIETVQTEIGSGGGVEALFGGGGGVSQNQAAITITPLVIDEVDAVTQQVRELAEEAFGAENVTVSAATQTGFGGFSLIITGESLEELVAVADDIRQTLGSVDVDGDGLPDITNLTSNIEAAEIGGNGTINRIDGRPAISFSGELETQNTLGVTNEAKQAVINMASLPAGAEVTEGFESEQQVQGFQSMIVAIGYSILLVYIIMAISFRSLIHPFTILFSLPFALVGASIALFITNSVLGISAMIGLLMLVGIVVTNAIVLMELVQQLRKQGKGAFDSLVQGGRTRLRPILMTALTAILALIPLAASRESGAVIASELATTVMGGLLVSTALTLIVVPVVYSSLDQYIEPVINRILRRKKPAGEAGD